MEDHKHGGETGAGHPPAADGREVQVHFGSPLQYVRYYPVDLKHETESSNGDSDSDDNSQCSSITAVALTEDELMKNALKDLNKAYKSKNATVSPSLWVVEHVCVCE